MGNNRYIDYELIKKYPNKYNLTPKKIDKLKVLDWDQLKTKTWLNGALSPDEVWCHLEGTGFGIYGDYINDFWIGFYRDGRIRHCFSCWEGMCHYNFDNFYDINEIENKDDMEIQAKAIKWLNEMIDLGILGVEDD